MVGPRPIFLVFLSLLMAGCSDSAPSKDPEVSVQSTTTSPPLQAPSRLVIGNSFTDRTRDASTSEEWTSTEVVEAQEAISVRGESRTAFRIKATDAKAEGAETFVSWVNDDGTEIYRLAFDDLQIDFDPPCRDPTWPLEVGRSFDSLCRGYVMVEGVEQQITMTFDGEIQGKESVTVPAGTFSAFKVLTRTEFDFGGGTTLTTTSTDFFAPDACWGTVKSSSADSDGYRETYETLSFNCKPS